jgi:AcrR family transcriptional regulator
MTREALSTEERLVTVAIGQFGLLGLEAASTRTVAQLAGTQMSSITYHFDSKECLYLAAAQHIASMMSDRLSPI